MLKIKIFTDATEENINQWIKENVVSVQDIKRTMIQNHYESGELCNEWLETIIVYEPIVKELPTPKELQAIKNETTIQRLNGEIYSSAIYGNINTIIPEEVVLNQPEYLELLKSKGYKIKEKNSMAANHKITWVYWGVEPEEV